MAKIRGYRGRNPNSKMPMLARIENHLQNCGVRYRHVHLSHYGGISNVMVVFKQKNTIDDMEHGIRALQEIVTEKYSKLCVCQYPGTDRVVEIACEVI
jgi:hypothetical protein